MLEVAVGSERICVDVTQMTPRKAIKLSELMGEVRAKYSYLKKYPMLDAETDDQWQERVRKSLEAEAKRKPDEAYEDFVLRVNTQKLEGLDEVFDALVAIATAFGMEAKVSREAYEDSPYVPIKNFIKAVLDGCALVSSDFG